MVATTATPVPGAHPESDTSASPTRSAAGMHFPALDGCRAIAAGGVFVTHLGLLSGFISRNGTLGPYMARMDVGVSVFFVLSGFLLYRPFAVARFTGKPTRATATYARRRILRIFPAYWVALLIIAFILKAPGFEEPHSFVAHFFLLHIYDGTQLVGGPIQQSWTLATELGFYIFLPVWAWLMSRTDREPKKQLRVELAGLVGLLALSAAGNVGLVLLKVDGSTYAQLGTWLPFRLTDFVPGMALAVASAWVATRSLELPKWVTGPALAFACWAVSLVVFWFVSSQLDLPMFPTFTTRQAFVVRVLYLAVAILFIAPAVLGRHRRDAMEHGGVTQALLGNRVIVWVGLVSYGIYIWHEAWMVLYHRWFNEPVLAAGIVRMGLFSLVTTVVTAALSWYFVEKPVIGWGRSQGRASKRTRS